MQDSSGAHSSAVSTDPPWLGDLLVCPRCHGKLTQAAGIWTCGSCGEVGRRTVGFSDFLIGIDRLPMAGGDTMQLADDAAAAAGLAAAGLGFAELTSRAGAVQAEAVGRSRWSARRRRACDRFHARIGHLNFEASTLGGEALLAKVDSKIGQLGWPALDGALALEAGGGAGFFLPAFSQRFTRVVFVDASLVAVLLAATLCREQGIENVAFLRGDVTALPLASSRFDMVHENGVIEHVESPRRMLAEAARLRSPGGYAICVSPNRFTIAPEPHFGLPLYGLVPAPVRRTLVPLLRGFDDGSGTRLRSLTELRKDVAEGLVGDQTTIFFLPRELPFTARHTRPRRLVRQVLAAPVAGDLFDLLVNRAMLRLAPQHIVIARRGSEIDSTKGD